MPDAATLLDRCRALAVISGIKEGWRHDWAYYGLNADDGSHSCLSVTMYREARAFDVHFTDSGVLVHGHDIGSFRSFDGQEEGDDTWARLVEEVPEGFKSGLWSGG
ncbi:hypothetical protein [Streptomyces sp. NPDC056937]|uniref:hypothetical protein n=1 Tax=Streptomyces sp. NPDC056937 TaxID=3345969 RepID=UPI00362F3DD1